MRIYPAIDIKGGQCVRLIQGDFDQVTVFHENPVQPALDWVAQGASFLHTVDLDGARMGSGYNNHIIGRIASAVPVPIQLGGGIRTLRDIEEKLALGVGRVILGTVAIENPELVREAVRVFGDKIAVGIDAKDGSVAISGWEQVSSVKAVDCCRKMADMGVKTIIYTDISKDGMMCGPNIEATKELIDAVPGVAVIASGGVSAMKDLEDVEAIGAAGVIIGKALYQGAISLREAINRYESR